jgi:hypothetical protein
MREDPMPPSAEELATDDAAEAFVPGKGEGESGMDAADIEEGSNAGEEAVEMDCLRTDRNASDADAAMVDVGRRCSARPRVCAGKRPNEWKRVVAQRRRVDGWKLG